MSVMPMSLDMPPSRTTTGWMLDGMSRVTMKQIGTSMRAMMLRTAYVTGRTAEPCEEQVEAVAKYLADTSDGWNTLTEVDREPFRETAAEILQVARKAVM